MELTYNDLINKLEKGINFSFARTGDGELSCIFGAKGGCNKDHNCDQSPYYPDLGNSLYDILVSEQRYYMGMQRMGFEQRKNDPEFIEATKDIEWCNADILHHASIKGHLECFNDALSHRKVILVCNHDLKKLSLKTHGNVLIKKATAWKEFDQILGYLKKMAEADVVIIYCAGMMAGVLIDRMFDEFGLSITQIDAGSVLDPYAGNATRKYHKDIIKRLER
jgi:hypothetical protein